MYRLGIVLIIILFASPAWADTHVAESCSLAHVNAALGAAEAGDTVTVPAGSCTWDARICTGTATGVCNTAGYIERGVVLQGSYDATTITANWANEQHALIHVAPNSTSIAANEAYRITGFILDGAGKVNCATVSVNSVTAMTNIRIDHNTFINGLKVDDEVKGIRMYGSAFGVIDNNTFSMVGNVAIDCEGDTETGYAGGIDIWAARYDPATNTAKNSETGSIYNVYIEDNNFLTAPTWIAGGHGMRYVARYNTFGATDNAHSYTPGLDFHGNQTAGMATMIGEVYGNKFIVGTGYYANYIVDQRGGIVRMFYNNVHGYTGSAASVKVREEYNDADTNAPLHNPGTYYMRPMDSYFWINAKSGTTLINAYQSTQCVDSCGYTIAENSNWYDHDSTNCAAGGEACTAGVGCGTLANRPASCTAGVGYWATDQSCSDVSAYVGAGGVTATKKIVGTLYKCTATDTWTQYYEPYDYPHPLTLGDEGDTTAPVTTITTSDPQSVTTDTLTVAGTATDAVWGGGSSCKYRIGSAPDADNGTACTGTTSWICSTSGYTIGANTLYVGCGDAAGNWGSDSITVNYNRVKPIITLNVGPVWTLQ